MYKQLAKIFLLYTLAVFSEQTYAMEDSDGDLLSDEIEAMLGTDPFLPDTDGDELDDGIEDANRNGVIDANETNPLLPDTDGDSLTDSEEINIHGTDPLLLDTDSDSLTDSEEINIYATNPLLADTDGDGLTDADEINIYGTNPLLYDTDSDDLSDSEEITYGTNPLAADTDGDGAADNADFYPLDSTHIPDADGDGLLDVTNLYELNAMRYSFRDGFMSRTTAEPDSRGCPNRCIGYELINDLDFDTNMNGQADSGDEYWNTGEGWEPVPEVNFFEGNHNTIHNLFINRPNTNKVGLFGSAEGITLRNLSLINVDVIGSVSVGALAGVVRRRITGGIVESCYASGVVKGAEAVGGLIGWLSYQGEIHSSSSSVSLMGTTADSDRIGGLVGYLVSADIEYSFATGNVQADKDVGGLVGYSVGGNISNSYSHSDVSGRIHVGGLIGRVANIASINNSYAATGLEQTGTGEFSGGLIGGINSNNPSVINASHWDYTIGGVTVVTNPDDVQPTLSGNTRGLTTGSIQCPSFVGDPACTLTNIFIGWDETIWNFNSSAEYPTFRDTDNDGIINTADPDDDNDGVPDEDDAFPLDPNESADTDLDGIGNNADLDDDNDQIEDTFENFYGLNALDANDATLDLDGDGINNLDEYLQGTDPGIPNAANQGNSALTRADLAKPVLLAAHGLGFIPPAATGTVYSDVANGDFHAAWIEQMQTDGISEGCAVGNYCPDQLVTMEQIAPIILRAKFGGTYTPPPASGTLFSDVTASDFAADWIEELFNQGISQGCALNRYCPKQVLTQSGLQSLLDKAFP